MAQDKIKILKARAIALAKEPEEKLEEEYIELLEFQLANENYGIESRYIREVYPLKLLTPLPCTPSFVLGIINVRGQILSVIDIQKIFEIPHKVPVERDYIIIIQNNQMEFGILAHKILGTRQIQLKELQPSLPTLTGIRANYLKGVTRGGMIVLDAEKILSDKKIIVNEEV